MLDAKELRIRVTPEQHSQIKLKAHMNGYQSISAYIRDRILRLPYQAEQRLREIYQIIKEKQ